MKIDADNVYILDDIEYRDTIDRLLPLMAYNSLAIINYEKLNELGEQGKLNRGFNGHNSPKPDIYFMNGRYEDSEDIVKERIEKYPNLNSVWLGYFGINRRSKMEYICKPTWQLHSIQGCLFSCAYCVLHTPILIIANTDKFLEIVEKTVQENQDQLLWQYDNETDIACFEPEYGVSKRLIELFGKAEGQYLELYVGKSADVNWLLNLDHKGKTVCTFSLSGWSQSTLIEEKTDSSHSRIEASRKLRDVGYPVRFRLSPIIPITNWKQEYSNLISRIFATLEPDVITLDILRNHNYESMDRFIGLECLDNDFLKLMKGIAPNTEISNEYKIEVYSYMIDEIRRYSKTSIALCRENLQVWENLEDKIGQRHNNYRCNCGTKTIPLLKI